MLLVKIRIALLVNMLKNFIKKHAMVALEEHVGMVDDIVLSDKAHGSGCQMLLTIASEK